MSLYSFDKIISEMASPDRLVSSLIAVALVALVGILTGPLRGNANPGLWGLLDMFFGGIARKTYNTERSHGSLAFRGTFFALLFVTGGLACGIGAHLLEHRYPLGGFLEPLLLSLTLTGGTVWLSLHRLYHALAKSKGQTKASFLPLAVSARADLNTTDDFGIVRTGIGFMAQSFDRGLVAPLVWYLVGGLPLAFFYAALASSRWALAKDGFSKGLGDTALWLEKFFGMIPGLIAGIYLSIAALFTPGARLTRALPGWFAASGRAPYAQGGLAVTATAWALNVSLGGPVHDLDGSVLKKDWVGPAGATAKLDKSYLRRAIYMSLMAYVLVIASLIGGIFGYHLAHILS